MKRRRRGYKKARSIKAGFKVPRPLVYPSRRKLTVYRKIPVVVLASANSPYQETINGLSRNVGILQVCTNPFSAEDAHGTTKYRHSILPYWDGTASANYSCISVDAGGDDVLGDVKDICERYLSCRVAGMRVELTLQAPGHTNTGANTNWGYVGSTLDIVSAFVSGDTDSRLTGNQYFIDKAESTSALMRLPGHKVNHFIHNTSVVQGISRRRYVLFSRKFRKVGGGDTITSTGSGIAGGDQAVQPGGWDHRAIYNTSFGNAYTTMSYPETRAGKLHVHFRYTYPEMTGEEGWLRPAGGAVVGFMHTWHDIELANDKNAYPAQA